MKNKFFSSAVVAGMLAVSWAQAGELHDLIMQERWGDALQKIAEGKGINEKNEPQGFTPLHNAAYKGQMPVVIALVEAGADVNARDRKGFTALHHASYKGHQEVVDYLLKKGADPSIRSVTGKTAADMKDKGVGMELKPVIINQR